MPDAQVLTVFIATVGVLLAIPGPGMLYILARGIDQGRLAALASVLGFQAGDAIYVIAAAFGLTALLFSSALAFSAIKYAGVAYLIYLGLTTLATPPISVAGTRVSSISIQRVFFQGAVVNMLNPKTGLFFIAFLPQFVDPDRGSASLQILVLGGVFMLVALLLEGSYALLSGIIGGLLCSNQSFLRRQRFVTRGIYLLLASVAAFSSLAAGIGV
ncbi:MAG: LysE family translocator [Thermomicrobiaceae bacterium]